jgi:protein-tyrosine-phosphatase/DNA-binding transcriptional ArsR family regulator
VQPPPFLQLAAHPLRWQLLSELARSDLRVNELTSRTSERQNLVSYHLKQLRDGGLVSRRRSTADGRDSYYVLDLARCRQLLASAGTALHPALALESPETRVDASVLFLCTGNSARSQMAEAIANRRGLAAASAGSHPKPLNPRAVETMQRRGIDLAHHRSKHLDEYDGEHFDVVVTLCDRVREVCPDYPRAIHWSVPEPKTDDEFERTAAELETRIHFLIGAITCPTSS